MLTLDGHKRSVNSVAVSADGALLATGGADGTIRLWDAANAFRPVSVFKPERRGILSVSFAPDGRSLAFVWANTTDIHGLPTVGLLELPSGQLLHAAETPVGMRVFQAAIAPDGRALVSVGREGLAQWRLPKFEPYEWGGSINMAWGALAFAPDGRLAAGLCMSSLQFWSAGESGRYESKSDDGGLLTGGEVRSIAFAPDGRLVAAVAGTAKHRRVHVWDSRTREVVAEHGGQSIWEAVAFAPDGRRIVTVGRQGTARTWEAESLKQLGTFDWQAGKLLSTAFTPDGLAVVAGTSTGQVLVWDAE